MLLLLLTPQPNKQSAEHLTGLTQLKHAPDHL
jgi:hypothetical protein